MKKVADVLYLMATFSVRTAYVDKAEVYARIGYELYPNDRRIVEIYAYVLLLRQEFDEVDAVLSQQDFSTPNLEFLKSRLFMLTSRSKEDTREQLRKYLAIY